MSKKKKGDLYTEVFYGYRMWNIDGSHLYSMLGPWPHDEKYVAQCPYGHENAPVLDCTCGFYSKKTKEQAAKYFGVGVGGEGYAFGKVAIWGRIIEHTSGYRAQFTYPSEFWLPKGFDDQATLSVLRHYAAEIKWV